MKIHLRHNFRSVDLVDPLCLMYVHNKNEWLVEFVGYFFWFKMHPNQCHLNTYDGKMNEVEA